MNKLHSAGIKDIQLINFSAKIGNLNTSEIGTNHYLGLGNEDAEFKSKLISLESKYLHWENEVSGSQFSPIFDSNVKNEIKKIYKI